MVRPYLWGLLEHDRGFHKSPVLPADDAHVTSDPIEHVDGSIAPAKLKAIDSPADGEAATYDQGTGKFEWVPAAAYDPLARQWFISIMGDVWTVVYTGSGNSPQNNTLWYQMNTGATANSYYAINPFVGYRFTKNQEFEWYLGDMNGIVFDTNGIGFAIMGQMMIPAYFGNYTATRDKAGFYFVRDATYASRVLAVTACYSPAGYTITDLGPFPTAPTCYRIKLVPGVKCEFYINGSLVATHTTTLPRTLATLPEYMFFGVSSYLVEAGDKFMILKTWQGFADY